MTDSALVVRARRVDGAPLVTVRALIAGGGRVEPHPGTALLAGRLLVEGTARRSFRQISDESEDCGMAISSSGSFEGHGLSIEALARDLDRALEWTVELLFESVFPPERFDLLRRQAAAEIESLADQADVLTGWGFLEQLYAPHPLSRRLQGDADSLASLTAEDCAAFHERALRRRLIVAVSGAIDEDAVRRRLEDSFAGLASRGSFAGEVAASAWPEPAAPYAESPLGLRHRVVTRAADQAHLFLGHRSVDRRHPDLPALDVLAVILGAGAGLTGRIPHRIRESEGLAYTAAATTAAGAGLDPGRMMVYVGTAPATVDRAENAAREELARLLADGVSDREVDDAKNYLLGREPFRRETASQWASLMIEAEFYGLPVDDPRWSLERVRAVDRAAVEAAARQHIQLDRLHATVGLPSESDPAD